MEAQARPRAALKELSIAFFLAFCHIAQAKLQVNQHTPAATAPTQWGGRALQAPRRTVLGQPDVYSCSLLQPGGLFEDAADASSLAVTRVQLRVFSGQSSSGARLYRVLLLECDAAFWQLQGVQEQEHVCIANTGALRASCNQWLLDAPADNGSSESVAPEGTAFALPSTLQQGRVLLLQAHWRLPAALNDTAVQLPGLELRLGATTQQEQAAPPALLGSFVGAGVYPPSSVTRGLQGFRVPVPSTPEAAATATAELECGKRCTYTPLGGYFGQHVTVAAFEFGAFDRASHVSFEVQRGPAGREAAAVRVSATAGQGMTALQEPFQLFPGDTVRWRCTYDVTGLPPGSSLTGGYSSNAGAAQEQCTVSLQYWPRVDAMRGCTAALLSDALLGENMCSNEQQDLLALAATEGAEFPLRRMYAEHSFPGSNWMGGWKATGLVLALGIVWSTLWASTLLLSRCTALGPIHRRFVQLAPGQQRNVAVYVTHLLLDTLVLAYVSRPMLELWSGAIETTAAVRTGMVGFTYIVACYALELTWRRRIDTMLAIHHVGTITIILLYAGEFTASTYRVSNAIIVLAAFALMEQPTYVALLCKRMLPANSKHVVVAARVGYISWFVLKGASVLLAVTMFVEDWHLMPTWLRVNFVLTWVIATLVQGWSGVIQYGIYRHILRSHRKAKAADWEQQQQVLKRHAAAALSFRPLLHGVLSSDEEPEESDGGSSSPSYLCHPLLLSRPSADGCSAESCELADCIGTGRVCSSAEPPHIIARDAGPIAKCLPSWQCSSDDSSEQQHAPHVQPPLSPSVLEAGCNRRRSRCSPEQLGGTLAAQPQQQPSQQQGQAAADSQQP